MTIYHQTIPQMIRMLTSLDKMFTKAEQFATAKKFEVNNLLQMRLAPDMYPLVKQVQVASDTAKAAAARLTGQEPPRYEDNERTIDEVHERLKKTINYLKTFKVDDFKGCEDRKVNLPWAPGKYMHGSDYVTEMALPNFYFHTTTAYAILRHNGVDIGKMDFLGDANIKG